MWAARKREAVVVLHVDNPEQVKVGHDNLMGEVIRISADQATIQVYEETGANHPIPYLRAYICGIR